MARRKLMIAIDAARRVAHGTARVAVVVLIASAASAALPPRHNQILSRPWFHGPVADDDCTVCHTIHASSTEKNLKAPIPQLCYQCHENMASKDVVHEPVGKGRCTDCHEVHTSLYRPLLIRRVPELCLECHPLDTEHKTRGTLCTGCHGVHSSETSRFLDEARTSKCGQCHQDKRQGEWVHEPAKEGKCLSCHFTHPDPRFKATRFRASYPAGVTPSGDPLSYGLCVACHPTLLQADPNASTTQFRTASRNLHAHHIKAGKKLSCSTCHDMHAARRPALLLEWVRFSDRPPKPLQYLRFDAGGSCGPVCHGPAVYLRASGSEIGAEEE